MPKPAILLSTRFLSGLKNLSNADLGRAEEALRLLPECFSQPHLHAGISIRRLRGNVFECRAGLKIRLLFRAQGPALEFFCVGDHDEVRRLIRSL